MMGRYSEAADMFDQARAKLDGDDSLRAGRHAGWQARAALFAGNIEEARETLEVACELSPGSGILRRRRDTQP